MDFTGSVAAITGAACGIGIALAQEAVRSGMATANSDFRTDTPDEAHGLRLRWAVSFWRIRAMEQTMRNYVTSDHATGPDEIARQTFDAAAGQLYVLPVMKVKPMSPRHNQQQWPRSCQKPQSSDHRRHQAFAQPG